MPHAPHDSDWRPVSPLKRLPFSARSLPVFRGDILIVGAGSAGLSAALSAAEEGAHVMVLAKGDASMGNTRFAQGGVAAAVGDDDDPQIHAADTLRLGYGLSEAEIVHQLTNAAPDTMDWLSSLGMAFDHTPNGHLELGREGGHRVARILHSGSTSTGRELQRVLLLQAKQHPRIDLFTHVTAVDFVKDSEGKVSGAVCMQSKSGLSDFETVIFEASQVLLATGGGGQLYRETTNPQLATADGLAMALRAGAILQDLEFVQFHPTILYLAGAARFLISEVVRGEGAILRNRAGHAFMQDYHEDCELAPRDVVSRAIYDQMFDAGDTHVQLDLSLVPRAEERFPGLARIAAKFGIFIGSDPVPVRPAVHYFVGGVAADGNGQTSLPGLWAVGECASTGFHGANRMGSNSLLEALAHGRIVGRKMSQATGGGARRFLLPPGQEADHSDGIELNLTDITYSLKSLMWRQVGIVRDAEGLKDAVEDLRTWCGFLSHLGPFTPAGVETANMIQVGMAITRSALFREESRGAHYRSDFPQTEPAWQVHSRMAFQDSHVKLCTSRVRTSSQLSD